MRKAIPSLLLLCGVCVFFSSAIWEFFAAAASKELISDDARIYIWPFYRHNISGLFAEDYIATYVLDLLPVGYRALFSLVSAVGADPYQFSVVLSVLLFIIFLILIARCAWSRGGLIAGIAAVVFCLSFGEQLYLDRIAGGIPRSFGFPLTALVLFSLIENRFNLLIVATLLSAAFYPPIAICAGLMVAVQGVMQFISNVALRRKVAIKLVATALLCALLIVPVLVSAHRYGPLNSFVADDRIAELREGGRYSKTDTAPYAPWYQELSGVWLQSFSRSGVPWIEYDDNSTPDSKSIGWPRLTFALLALAALLAASLRVSNLRSLLVLVVLSNFVYQVATCVAPFLYVPSRHLLFLIGSLAAFSAGIVFSKISKCMLSLKLTRRSSALLTFGMLVAVSACLGGQGQGKTVLDIEIPAAHRELYNVIAALPPGSIIAGWPGELIDNVPLLAKRSVLLSFELHQVFHRKYSDEMRRRFNALLKGYFAVGNKPLKKLSEKYGVTHVIFSLRHIKEVPEYFQPFNLKVQKHVKHWRKHSAFTRQIIAHESTLYFKDYALVDLQEVLTRR